MGHDAHFLTRLDRVQHDQVEFALALYRDHAAVRFLLGRLDLESGEERVALAIGDDKKGPFVVVARDGHFVTCLGEGMSTGALRVLPRARVDALLAKHRDQKERESVRDLEKHERESDVDFWRRLMQRADAMTREQFVAFSAIQQLVALKLLEIAAENQLWVTHQVPAFRGFTKLRGKHLELARHIEQKRWLVGHMMLLATMGDLRALGEYPDRLRKIEDVTFTVLVTGLCSTTLALRGAWAASRMGKSLLPSYRSAAERADSALEVVDACIVITAIGLRHRALRDEARRALVALGKPIGREILDMFRAARSTSGLALLDAPPMAGVALDRGREIFISITRHLPEGHRWRFNSAEQVPDDVAKTAMLESDEHPFSVHGQENMMLALSLLADARAEDFYFPRELTARVIFETQPDELLEYLHRFDDAYTLAPATVENASKVGRNDRCPCGSGKKYEKCCAA